MGKLSSKSRDNLPKSQFALPGSRRFPINDKPHAIAAKARATQMAASGHISDSTAAKVKAAANKVLKKGK